VPGAAEWTSVESAADPADRITLDESIDMAFMVVLDSMSPAERVAFLLHDVFRYPFDEVGEVVGRSPGACRQLASSARRKVRDAQPVGSSMARRAELVGDFKRAWEAMDIGAMVAVLDPDAVAVADGGGLVPAAPEPRVGAQSIADFLLAVATRATGLELVEQLVNGQPGLVARQGGGIVTVFAFDVSGDRITRIWAVRNPEKLTRW
jgi:RNA polymerase sigma-70 factor (ECF subfamily)